MKTSTDQTARELAAALQAQLRRIGVALEIRPFEFATFYADINRGGFDLYSLRWISGNDDPDILSYLFDSQRTPPNGANRGHYGNPEVDRLLAETRAAVDLEERRKQYASVQRILGDDLPYVSLWYLDDVAVYNRRLRNLKLAPTGNYDFLREVEVVDGGGA
jgi:peptide/nickel transport system substrate-binding protein